ncbi:ATP-binding protein [Saccharothrix syringae]|uniref:Tetratricopeptide repeat protein n=1 Tax=Saccharothrix syringae TaxID=103733 RepID=A0A5Q0H141_SACSY|nr:tetratricopeptide repeat protein [Saccharothrix syringae]QFZ19392.1 tetratricopeptide repeat protein [Saccharothrix syringae]
MNEVGRVEGTAVQAGTLHGGVHLHAPRPTRPVPRQLPADASCFTGRREQLARLDARKGALVLITGTAGVGKTSLAVHWAHHHLADFPDGQLHVDLRGHSSRGPVTPGEALTGFLHSLNVAAELIPVSDEDKAALYRSLTHDRRLLVLLDNACTAEQVRPLLPASGTVLVTSRNRLAGLVARDGAVRVGLDVLPSAECVALLRATAGAERVDADPEGAARLAEQCAYLPLALRVAAERVAADPFTTLAGLTAELVAEEDRLDLLSDEEDESSAVRAVFSWSYRALSEEVAGAFRAFGLHPTAEASLPAVAALLGTPVGRARRAVDALVAAHLVQRTARDRYRVHDLLRAYAVELANDDPGRDGAIRRVLSWYLHTVAAADHTLIPSHCQHPLPATEVTPQAFIDRVAALHWCEVERANLVASVGLAATSGAHDLAGRFPMSLWALFGLRKYWDGWLPMFESSLVSARAVGDRHAEVYALWSLGVVHQELGQHDRAIARHREALAASRENGDRCNEAGTLTSLSTVYRSLRRFSEALDCLHESLALRERTDDQHGLAATLNQLGSVYRDLGRLDEALDHLGRSSEIRQRIGDRHGQGLVLNSLAATYELLGRLDDAATHFRRAIEAHQEVGNVFCEAHALDCLADLLHRLGDAPAAEAARRRATEVHDLVGTPEPARSVLPAPQP